MTTIAGAGGMVYLQGSGSTAVKIGEARTWRINLDAEYEDTTEFGDVLDGAAWVTLEIAALRWHGLIEGNLDTGTVTPFDAVTARSPRKLYLYTGQVSLGNYYYGTIWPRLSVENPLRGPARFELDFDGNGQLAIGGA